jgi:CRP/FNR family nitrogen fixation transcriptional regulator
MFDAAPVSSPALAPLYSPSAINASLSGTVTTFSAGAEIYAEGDRSGTLYQVVFGVVRIYRLLADGRRQICAFHMPGEIFGFETGSERHFFADAVNTVGLRGLRPGSEAELSHELLKLALTSLTRAHDHLLTVGRNDASGRVAAFLLEIADRQGTRDIDSIDLPMSRLDIADYLGLTIETVSRVFTRLKDQRVIRLTSTRHVDVLHWNQLEKLTA